jgi:hypothetical protein
VAKLTLELESSLMLKTFIHVPLISHQENGSTTYIVNYAY